MLTWVGERAKRWVDSADPFTNVYGVGRSLIALAAAATLLANSSATLFRPSTVTPDVPICEGLRAAGIYCMAAPRFDVARWFAIVVLLLVASGFRPRYTGVLHAWVAFSLQANAITIEGGDQVSAILALLLVPVTLMDGRRWHWSPREPRALDDRERTRRLIARACLTVIRVQVAGIYMHAGVGKFKVEEWTDGTALYYWLTHPTFGAPQWVAPLVRPLVLNGTCVALMTWGVLVVELLLAAGLLADKRWWRALLISGIALHAGILVLHGLVSFAVTMWGALILFLRPIDEAFSVPAAVGALRSHLRSRLRSRWSRRPSPRSPSPAAPAAECS